MKKNITLTLIAVAITACCSTVFSFIAFVWYFSPQLMLKTAQENQSPSKAHWVNISPTDMPNDFVNTSAVVTKSVCNITVFRGEYRSSAGSGVILSEDGYIVTNNHVIEGSTSFGVTLYDKREFKATFVGTDPDTDLALLKIEANNLLPIRFGDSDQLQVGEWVLAVGNPFNLSSTVTAGIVSAKARNIQILRDRKYSIESFIQTDAAVNPGNSGGALVNMKGELIVINTAIISESGGYEGFSFAIPASMVAKVVADIKQFGSVQRAILGIIVGDINSVLAQNLNLEKVEGVLVQTVTPGTTASQAGLQSGDVITAINGFPTRSTPELQEQVARYRPGDLISIDYIRKGIAYRKKDITLQSLKKTE